jgi:hypothetical protein
MRKIGIFALVILGLAAVSIGTAQTYAQGACSERCLADPRCKCP